MSTFSNFTGSSTINMTRNFATSYTVCLPVQDNIPTVDQRVRLAFAIVFGFLAILGLLMDISVVYLIKRTSQEQNQSIRLVMYYSIVDTFGSVIINGAYFVYMMFYEKIACTFLLVVHTMVNLSLLASLYVVAFIGFDRYMRVKHLNEYSNKFTPSRYFKCQVCYLILVIAQSILAFVGIYFFGHGYATLFTAPINFVLFLCMAGWYGLSIQKLRAHHRSSNRLSSNDRNVVKVATLYLFVFLLSISPVILWQIFHKAFLSAIITAEHESIILAVLYSSCTFHSVVNSVIFMSVTREAKRKVKSIWDEFCRKIDCFASNQVVVEG